MKNESWYVRHGRSDEATQTLDILREAAAWSLRFGDPIWPPDSFSIEEERRFAIAGEQIAGFEEAEMVACMRLQRRDPTHWPQAIEGEALYVHKLAVRRAWSGKNWPNRLVDWAAEECRGHGIGILRLDTISGTGLVPLYERLGFHLVDQEPQLLAERFVVRMERVLDVTQGTASDRTATRYKVRIISI